MEQYFNAYGNLDFGSKENVNAAVQAAKAYGKGSKIEECETIREILDMIGLFYADDAPVSDIWTDDLILLNDQPELLKTIAPFVKKGYIDCVRDSDSLRWRWAFANGHFREVDPVETYPSADETELWDKIGAITLDFAKMADNRTLSVFVSKENDTGYEIQGHSLPDVLKQLGEHLINSTREEA